MAAHTITAQAPQPDLPRPYFASSPGGAKLHHVEQVHEAVAHVQFHVAVE